MPARASSLDGHIADLLDGHLTVAEVLCDYSEEEIQSLVDQLKQEANRHWAIDPNCSLELAELIIQLGEANENPSHVALGTMARGDALKFLGRVREAWDVLEQAGNLYLEIGDEVGWARTCIGPLFICLELNQVDHALANAEKARAILIHHQKPELLANLAINQGMLFTWTGQYARALAVLKDGLQIAETLGEAGEGFLGNCHANIGYAYQVLTDFNRAEQSLNRALAIFTARGDTHWMTTIETNLASIDISRGHYRRALQRLHQAYDDAFERSAPQAADLQIQMVKCYFELNRYAEARDLARQAVRSYHDHQTQYAQAIALYLLAMTEAELSDFEAAQRIFDDAERIFRTLDTPLWSAWIRLRRATIALQQGATTTAYQETKAVTAYFEQNDLLAVSAESLLRQGQAAFACGQASEAEKVGKLALHIARQCNIAWMRYSTHLLLGHVAKAQKHMSRAQRHYQAAVATVDRVQRGLTISLRPGFRENKMEALCGLIQLYLDSGRVVRAFETLEHAKSQVFQSYLTSQDGLRWATDNPITRTLLEELEHLRQEHYRLNKRDLAESDEAVRAAQGAQHEIMRLEKRMRALTEQLYLHTPETGQTHHLAPLSIADVQRNLPDDALLIEYYNDGNALWAFALDQHQIEPHRLALTTQELDTWINRFHFNIACALKAGSLSSASRQLMRLFQQIAGQLYRGLVQPLQVLLHARKRLIIVPYGVLHYLPFHLLHDGNHYLCEQHEVVILPAAGLIIHAAPGRDGGALVLAHSREGLLAKTRSEAVFVQRLFGGQMYCDKTAQRSQLQSPPCQILHVAAHGEFRMDKPDLAYIELADGYLFADDLLQHDLSYELVTLSACETGRARVAAGDDLIGLGRGCLYAGASALLVSLWRVDDSATQEFMEAVYRALYNGASKAAALRDAQLHLIAAEHPLHPAFWGAFQLVGNADPLSGRPH